MEFLPMDNILLLGATVNATFNRTLAIPTLDVLLDMTTLGNMLLLGAITSAMCNHILAISTQVVLLNMTIQANIQPLGVIMNAIKYTNAINLVDVNL
jgi:hypothetical protein